MCSEGIGIAIVNFSTCSNNEVIENLAGVGFFSLSLYVRQCVTRHISKGVLTVYIIPYAERAIVLFCILSFSFNFVLFLIFGVAGLLPALVTLLVLFYSHRRIFAAWCLWEIKGYYSACFLLLLIQELCVIVHRTIILFWPKKGNKIMFWMFLLLLLFWIFFVIFFIVFIFYFIYIFVCLIPAFSSTVNRDVNSAVLTSHATLTESRLAWHFVIKLDLLFISKALGLSGKPVICVAACQTAECQHLSLGNHEKRWRKLERAGYPHTQRILR